MNYFCPISSMVSWGFLRVYMLFRLSFGSRSILSHPEFFRWEYRLLGFWTLLMIFLASVLLNGLFLNLAHSFVYPSKTHLAGISTIPYTRIRYYINYSSIQYIAYRTTIFIYYIHLSCIRYIAR